MRTDYSRIILTGSPSDARDAALKIATAAKLDWARQGVLTDAVLDTYVEVLRLQNGRIDLKEGLHVAVAISGDRDWPAAAAKLLATQHQWGGFTDVVCATFLEVFRGVADPTQMQEAVGYAQIASGDRKTAKAAAANLNFPQGRKFDPVNDPDTLLRLCSSGITARVEDQLWSAEFLGPDTH